MVNIFLCDDNPVQLRHVRDFIEDYTKDTQLVFLTSVRLMIFWSV